MYMRMTSPLDHIRIVLVRPLYDGNRGSICRAMMNGGITQLVLVQPRANPESDEARRMAVSARPVLDGLRIVDTIEEAVGDCAVVAATSAREGLYRGHSKSPREWAPHLIQAAADQPVAVMFGPEDAGLNNEELKIATHIIRIPSSPMLSSLNLAQAVMVCSSELFCASGEFTPPEEKSEAATVTMRERMLERWEAALWDIGFLSRDTGAHMMFGMRRIFSRAYLSDNDARILLGVAQQMQWIAKQAGKAKDADAGHEQNT